MEKDSEKKIWDGPITESKPDPIYQGGYTDGYEAGEQYGCITCRNDAIEEAAEAVESSIPHYLREHYAAVIRELKREITQ